MAKDNPHHARASASDSAHAAISAPDPAPQRRKDQRSVRRLETASPGARREDMRHCSILDRAAAARATGDPRAAAVIRAK